MLLLSGTLLFYTAVIVPVQICMWNYDDPCSIFPTLQFDIIVDTFFLVGANTARPPPFPNATHRPTNPSLQKPLAT